MEPLAHRSLSGTPCSLLDDKTKCTKTESEAHHVKVDRTVQLARLSLLIFFFLV
jgi:hypothetical protein